MNTFAKYPQYVDPEYLFYLGMTLYTAVVLQLAILQPTKCLSVCVFLDCTSLRLASPDRAAEWPRAFSLPETDCHCFCPESSCAVPL